MDEEPQRTDHEGSEPADAGEPERPSAVRYNRKWFLVLGGVAVAGVAGAIAGLKKLAGSEQGGPLSDMFGPFPVRSAEDVPTVPAAEWVITVDGLVERPLKIDHAAWSSLQRLDETVDFHCVEGWTVENVRWGGVAPARLLEKAGVKPEGKFAVFHAYGGTYLSSVPLDLVTESQTLLADTLNGEPLPAKHGGPVRLVVPAQLGYKNVKWVERIEITAAARAGYWEKRGYPEDAPIPGG
jgi:DMSO/TMAO reductase YedYZ molybdopterin-dependent catalytic subunit